ncbi:MAG: putative membrane protein [uncultured Lysobacter sp.]|uniref:Putative membrane protein n=1 Tax=uncultured Lysobacter sp. TaxID=271060 RepID=A0A6J4KMK8_9GAMM|nr:MAG: putative membrane protein [uncultured Lysobacter sp.]
MTSLHRASGRWRLGLALSLTTAACWATLPIALKIVLDVLDPVTLTWFRFLVAALCTSAWLGLRGGLGGYRALGRRGWAMLLVAAVMLLGNYVFYLLGVQYTSPGNAQLLIQLAPLLMALGGIFVFRESFGRAQWAGLAVLLVGLGLFFRDQLTQAGLAAAADASRDPGAYVFGSLMVLIAALVWAVYALAQKQLLMKLGSMQVLLVIYVVASLVLLPFARPATLLALDATHAALLLYCALNTVGAYGAFAEALAHWEASRVSAILATTPLLCIAAASVVHALWPQWLAPERITVLGWVGAGLAVAGSAAVSLLGRRAAAR